MNEVYRILKPKGIVLIVTPDVGSWTARIMKAGWPHYKSEHILYFSRSSLSILLRETGFSVTHMGTVFKYLTFEYVLRHFQKFNPGFIPNILKFLCTAFSAFPRNRSIRFKTEMLSIATREIA